MIDSGPKGPVRATARNECEIYINECWLLSVGTAVIVSGLGHRFRATLLRITIDKLRNYVIQLAAERHSISGRWLLSVLEE